MARRRRKSKAAPLIAVAVVVAVMWELIGRGDWWTVAQIATVTGAVAGFWVLFLRSTRCGYITYRGRPCRQQSPGELRGCRKYHKGLKAEALFDHIGIRHPRRQMQKAWMGSGEEPPTDTESATGQLERPAYDITMLVATVLSAVAAVAMPVVQMVLT